MAVIVTSGMKNPPEKLEFLQFLPRFQALSLLFLRISYLLKNLITIFRNTVDIVFQQIYQGYGNKGCGQGKPALERGTFVLQLLIF